MLIIIWLFLWTQCRMVQRQYAVNVYDDMFGLDLQDARHEYNRLSVALLNADFSIACAQGVCNSVGR